MSEQRERRAERSRVLSAHDQIVRTLAGDILAGRLAPADKLPAEPELLARFGVSRTALREALKTLGAKGFVQARTRVGTRVTDPSQWNLLDKEVLALRVEAGMDAAFRRELAEVRQALEPATAALAARNRTASDLRRMFEALADMARPEQSALDFARADLELHLAIGAASRNPMMRAVGAVIETALLEVFTLSTPVASTALQAETVAAHTRIVDAIEAGDAEGAARAMRAVIGSGHQRIEAERA